MVSTTSTTAVRNASALAVVIGVLLAALGVLPGSMDATFSNCTGWPFSSRLSRESKIGNR
ncbi:hypothetical protein D3C78_1559130 [compost metagenome]